MSNNSSDIAASTLLWFANEKAAEVNYPAIVFSGAMMTLGLVGNGLVFYVYGYQFQRTPANVYIYSLSVIDLVCCVFAIPFDIFWLRFPLIYGAAIPCKIFTTISLAAYTSQILLIICISRDRYYKICYPMKSFRIQSPNKNVLFALVLALCLSSPSFVVHGTKKIKMAVPGVVATTCSFDESLDHRVPVIYFGLCLSLAIADLLVLLFVYISIIRVVYRRSRNNLVYSTGVNASSIYKMSMTEQPFSNTREYPIPRRNNELRKRFETQVSKTSVIFLVVAASCVFSYIPYIVIELITNVNGIDFRNHSILVQKIMGVASMTFCISNVCNPIIYGIVNPNFRRECFRLFSCQKPARYSYAFGAKGQR
ncbi:neuropeptides capa receptor-like [Argopecten irradians]|uniref:neuropeptides capa receptor-like n=1 Tax=Argopecten irradians TaxID=31199 RepID=UPI00371F2F8B